jgi:cysteine desulfurase
MPLTGNASSVHGCGRQVRRLIEDSRRVVAAAAGGAATGLIFTSGGTEANALALLGSGRPRRLVSAVEHASVRATVPDAEIISVGEDGIVAPETVAAMLQGSPAPAVVSVMLANNETGVVQPVAAISAVARAYGAVMHCDAVQAFGKLPVDMAALGVHLLSLSAHKLGGPAGIGALAVAPQVPLASLLRGGGQERGRRAGSENLVGIAGFAAAIAATDHQTAAGRWLDWRDRIERAVRAEGGVIIAGSVPRLPNTSCIAMPGVSAETQVMAFDLDGIAVSAGAACSSGRVQASGVLKAMGLGEDLARCAIRVSFGWSTTTAEIDRFIEAWIKIHGRLRAAVHSHSPLRRRA